jgi:hypothetical protein
MPSLHDIAHGGWLCTFTIKQQLEIPSPRSLASPVRTTGMVWKTLFKIFQPAEQKILPQKKNILATVKNR